ncbi:MAG: hypothetical protein HUJ63_05600, partial [Enterococcus sp.]|nr:hypothetical protein [Enterococcus sp.]
SFGKKTYQELKETITNLRDKGAKSFVIDVRQNPGGLLDQAERMASMFLKNGETIVQFEDKKGRTMKEVASKELDDGFKVKEPVAVIIDGNSASASEIFAAALHESANVPLIGTKTFGKGTVQTVKDLNDQTEIKLTVLKWLTPKGEWINEKGIEPTIKADYPEYAYLKLIPRDKTLKEGDQSEDIQNLNAILAVSIAVTKAVSLSMNIPLYKLIGGLYANILPVPMMNIINGGAHSKNNLDIQEFMVVPVGRNTFAQALQMGTEIYHSLGKLLNEKRLSTCVGDEGGFAPDVASADEAIELIITAAQNIGYMPYCDFYIALDVASSDWYKDGIYYLPKTAKTFTTCELIESITALCDKFPIISVEDPLAETDYEGWTEITQNLGGRVLIVGDDLFVTN